MKLDPSVEAGLRLFVRYAYPPNERGYCGPDDHLALLAYLESGSSDRGLVELAKTFHGPWPYLKLLSERTGAGDPFSLEVVEAYWVGNELLDRVDTTDFGNAMESAMLPRVGGKRWPGFAEAIPGGIAHHSFHVFVTYPWVGLLSQSDRGEPLEILDRCRIRWGQVVAVTSTAAVVSSRHLTWDGRRLDLGPPSEEVVTLVVGGLGVAEPVRPGEWVSMHWGWLCDRLTPRRLRDLKRFSERQLRMTNEELARPGPAIVLG